MAQPETTPSPAAAFDTSADIAAPVAPSKDSPLEQNTSQASQKASFRDVMSCFLSTFVTIFLAEIGDKTQIATLLMSAQSHKPLTVFIGAATALIATSLVGVLLGRWLSKVLTPRTLERVTGVILAVVSVLLFIDVAGA
ncbi:TMEM165/GDT1 family protein [filamentous cyanobacterium LEGE 11480]|uniref:GDT1 family protein n=1 Tax=Romeriopsis navalis LEGE 11480 TaxID=2777977 RepID=A0A928VIQ5_9CYAN|nr:TMEM165/GDT1 family protein [Romeriopsis navalis]MBE9028422.1 TMEM165/GDT1 family protein [Romeriopsis navalis LEGE 11480]